VHGYLIYIFGTELHDQYWTLHLAMAFGYWVHIALDGWTGIGRG
jgi:hypothetical protein